MQVNMTDGIPDNQVDNIRTIGVRCLQCGMVLFNIMVTETSDESCCVIGRCGSCGGSSIKHNVGGKFYIGAANDCMELDCLDSDDENTQVVLAKRA